MNTPDERLLRLIDVLKFQKKIRTINEFCEEVGLIRQTIYRIRKGEVGFTASHINTICKKYKVNANWIFGNAKKVFLSEDSIEI
jgi:transcriptional regulator with XRE-family HTH domain